MEDYNAQQRGIQGGGGDGGAPEHNPNNPVQGIQALSIPPVGYPPYYQPAPVNPQHDELRRFWQGQSQEVHHVGTDPAEFKNHQLPLARIKKIMKSDEDVRMISAEAPVLFAKACEMFILELSIRSWNHSEENKRRTLQRNDISAAITRTDIFDFLVDIVPRDEQADDGPSPRPAVNAFPSQSPLPIPGPSSWQASQIAGPPPAANSTGPLDMTRPQQAVDPAVMQFYMQPSHPSNPPLNPLQSATSPNMPSMFIAPQHASRDESASQQEPPDQNT